jgi:perosamine synthetase
MDIPLFKTYSDEKDVEAVKEVIERGTYWATGGEIEEFEERICDHIGTDNCSVFNSGGSAGYALMKAHGIGEGDEVIVPSFTFVATAFWPIQVGAEPVFADVEKETFGLDPEDVREKITENTEAIMPIHYGGMPCKIDDLKEIAEENDVLLIEDAAESFGAKYRGKPVGSFGGSAVFSFCHNKVFSTSEGGAIVTDSDEVIDEANMVRSYGRKVEGNYFLNPEKLDYVEPGQNMRMSTILAALGISQIEKVDDNIEMRRQNADYLNKKLEGLDDVITPEPYSEEFFHVYQMYTIRVKEGREVRDNLAKHLDDKGITTRIYFRPIHKYTVFKERGHDPDLPTTEELSGEVLTLPMYPEMTEEEMDYIVKSVRGFFE